MPNRLEDDPTLRAVAERLHEQPTPRPPVRRPPPPLGRCRKQGHATEGKALAALRSLQRRGMERAWNGKLRVYKCPRCLNWHVGHYVDDEVKQP